MPAALELCQEQFNVISLNFASLMQHCTSAEQQQALRDLKDAALGNLVDAQNRIFEEDDANLKQLIATGQGALNAVNASIARIDDIATTLNNISRAVDIAANVVALGVIK